MKALLQAAVLVAQIFCHTHTGEGAPGMAYASARSEGCIGAHVNDDYGYPTGRQSFGAGQCTTRADFFESYLCIWNDLDYHEATADMWVQPNFGDHNWGEDAITNGSWSDNTNVERWDGTFETLANILANGRYVIHTLFISNAPNPGGFDADPAQSGFDFAYRFGGGNLVLCLESVARRQTGTDSLISTDYAGTGHNQEQWLEDACAALSTAGKPAILQTVRWNGPSELQFTDNWTPGRDAGKARVVARIKAGHVDGQSCKIVVLSGDRHICEVHVGLGGVDCEITIGPSAATIFQSTLLFNNGKRTVLAAPGRTAGGVNLTAGQWARTYGVIDWRASLRICANQANDDGTTTELAAATVSLYGGAPVSVTSRRPALAFTEDALDAMFDELRDG